MKDIVSGIYKITNKINRHVYIGSAVDVIHRWGKHIYRLNKNDHHSKYLQHAWNKYGADCFEFVIIEECSRELLIEREQFFIDTYQPEYNIALVAGSCLGTRRTQETKDKMRLAKLGKKMSPSFIAKQSARMMGNKYSVGHKVSPETRAKTSATMTGMPHLSLLGIEHSQETKDKMSISTLAYWARVRPGRKERDADIVIMRDSGESFVSIASKHDITPQRASQIYRKERDGLDI